MEQVKTLFPNVEKYDENAVMDQEAGIAFLSNNNKNVDAIYIGSEEDYLYKGIHVGMTKKDVNAKLGEPAQDDNDGWSCWYYDAAGERVEKEEDAVYIVNVEYDDDNIAELLILGYYQQSVTNAILVSIENQNALLDLSDSDIEVYLDGEYMVSIAEGDVRILMLPYDEKNHKITVKKSGKEKQSVTFSVKDCEDLDGTVYGIGFNVNYSLIAVERVQQKDFYYAYADFFYLYVLVIDGKPVDLSEVEMSKWLQEMYNFAR
jgi:hypothetical protein